MYYLHSKITKVELNCNPWKVPLVQLCPDSLRTVTTVSIQIVTVSHTQLRALSVGGAQ